MTSKKFGYIRISTKEQNIDRQLNEMLENGIDERDIFIDKQSGKDFERPQYQALKYCIRENDLLYIKSIDRFGRNSKEIKREWDFITNELKANIIVLDMPLLDTTKHKDLLGNFVSDLVLQVLSFVAENERESIRKRQAEGIAAAKRKGKKLGRPAIDLHTLSPEQMQVLENNFKAWEQKNITSIEFMRLLDIKKNSFYKIIKAYKKEAIKNTNNQILRFK